MKIGLSRFAGLVSFLHLMIAALPIHAVTVTLAWDPNSESNLAGYKIYYKTDTSGFPYDGQGADQGNSPINIPLAALANRSSPRLTVTGLEDGVTYYFAATAYDTEQNESGYSNEVFYGSEEPPSPPPPDEPPQGAVTIASVELEIIDSQPSTQKLVNLSTGSTMISSGNIYNNYGPERLVDGVPGEEGPGWIANGTPNWVIIDLGSTHTIKKIVARPASKSRTRKVYYYPNVWRIRYSIESDPDNWLEFLPPILVANGDPGSTGYEPDYFIYVFSVIPTDLRRVRLDILEGGGDRDGDSIFNEIEIWGMP